MTLKELRIQNGLTQAECAAILGISRRTYQSYESGSHKPNVMHDFLASRLEALTQIDETHGVVDLQQIKAICSQVFSERQVVYCYLFGSYAKGTATPLSDIDLLINTPLTGMDFFELAETLREGLKKKVDLLNLAQLNDNISLIDEILRDGIKIYG